MNCQHCNTAYENPNKLNLCRNCIKTLNAIDKSDIKNLVRIVDVLEHFRIQKNENSKKYCCVNHVEQNPSMDIRKNFAHCYVCGFTGDAIAVYMSITGCNMALALLEMNDAFCNGAFRDTKIDRRKLIKRIVDADLAREAQEAYCEKDRKVYSTLCDAIKKLEAESERYKAVKNLNIFEHEDIIVHQCDIESKIVKYNSWLDAYFYDNESWKNFVKKIELR